MSFAGFDPAAIALLDEMPGWDAARYAESKALLAAGLSKPGLALIGELAGRLDPNLTVVPRSSVSPLHTDLRFAKVGAPRYKDHLLLTTWAGADKRESPTLWIRIAADAAGFASGMALVGVERERWRQAVAAEEGAALAEALDRLARGRGAEVAGDALARTPPPWSDAHPRADLLRRTGIQVRFIEPLPDSVASPGFADWCLARLEALMPVHRWLVRHVAPPN